MKGYDFHPQALADLDEIWEFIRADSLAAADRVIEEILARFAPWFHFLMRGTDART